MAEIIEIKQLAFNADTIEALIQSMLKRTMRELTVKEYINIIQLLQSGIPIEPEKE